MKLCVRFMWTVAPPKKWQDARHQAFKLVLVFLAQDPETGILSYGNAEIKHQDKNDEVLTFVDFWKESHGHSPKCLIFDSRLTTYENLSKLNQDGVTSLTDY